jgi:hypothetical protein
MLRKASEYPAVLRRNRMYRRTIEIFGSRKLDNRPTGGVSAASLTV